MVRAQLIEKLKHNTLDTIIAVGHRMHHTHVELFTMTDSKWDIKKDYPYTTDISFYSLMAVEKTFILFGGYSYQRGVLTNRDKKRQEFFRNFLKSFLISYNRNKPVVNSFFFYFFC